MSRVGKQPIPIPSGVTVTQKAGGVEVKGPRGTLFEAVRSGVSVKLDGGQVSVSRQDDSVGARSAQGLVRSLINNMVTGVATGFQKRLEIVGVGYRAEVKGSTLVLALGFSQPVNLPIPKGISVKAERPTSLTIEGADRQAVGAFAAAIRALRKPEPYKGKGIKYADERVRRKVGKSAATGGTK
jgi:large subunit ribosomal protein L6